MAVINSQITGITGNRRNHYKKGQGILDYVFVLLIAIVVLLIMGYYIRNSLSGKMRDSIDTFGKGETYLPHTDNVTNSTVITVNIENRR